ncbi:hypothetical protein [Lactococcus lactis]|uniref:hypothetical protein n=1 Tax=Lactococcus lactis TaxID=1358 RepID=UPI00128EE55B|nr:hypothetical protein [Lactococcus lactis]
MALIIGLVVSVALWLVTHDNIIRLSDNIILIHFHTGAWFALIAAGFGVLLIFWAFLEFLFSKRSFVPMYRFRRLLQGLTTEISSLAKKIPDEKFHGCPMEYWRLGTTTYLKVFTTGFVRDGVKEQLPELIQDYLISECIGIDKDSWTYIRDTKIGAGYVQVAFGENPSRSIMDFEDFSDED